MPGIVIGIPGLTRIFDAVFLGSERRDLSDRLGRAHKCRQRVRQVLRGEAIDHRMPDHSPREDGGGNKRNGKC